MNAQLLQYYSLQGLSRAVDVYNGYMTFPPTTKILGYRFLLQHGYKEPRLAPTKEDVVKKVNNMVKEYSVVQSEENNSVVMDLVDILLNFSPKDGNKLLEELRKAKLKASKRGPTEDGTEGTVYADSQSSHNKDINESMKRAAKKLVTKNLPNLTAKEMIERRKDITGHLESSVSSEEDKKSMNEVLERIWIDNARFGIGTMLTDILVSLCEWIGKHKKSGQLYIRLIEELLEGHRYCSTGILGRLINVMQGFTDDPDYQIRISIKEQCKSVIFTYINNQLQECSNPNVMDGMLDRTSTYLLFIKGVINNRLREWKGEYGEEFYMLIEPTVEEYVRCKIY